MVLYYTKINHSPVCPFSSSDLFQLIIPVLVDTIWCAYMFDTYFSELHILDPAHSTERYKLHQQLHPILDDSLRKCLTSFYQGWSLEPLDQWKMKYPQLGPVFNRSTIFKFLDICRASLYRNDPFTVYVFFCTFSDDCGTIMLHYARNYNGMYLDEPLNEVCFASL